MKVTENNHRLPSYKPNTKQFFIICLLSLLELVILLTFSGNKTVSAQNAENTLLMQDAPVQVSRIELQDSYLKPRTVYGRIESRKRADIGFELAGTLRKLAVEEGAFIRQGDVLAILDTKRLEAQKNELTKLLERRQAQAKLASLSNKRLTDLVQKKVESQQALDESNASLVAAIATVNEVKAQIQSVQVQLDKSVMLAPFDGQIVAQYLDEGTVVAAGIPVFAILSSQDLEARFGLPEYTASLLQVSQVLPVVMDGITVPARVKSISSERDPRTRTIEAIFTLQLAQLPNNDKLSSDNKLIVSGDLVSLSFDIPTKKTGAWVPISALATGVRGMWLVYTINHDSLVEPRIVNIEFADESRAYISGAIESSDQIVINGVHRLAPNQTLNNVIEVKNLLSKIAAADTFANKGSVK